MKIIEATDTGNSYRFRIHLDEKKTVDGHPDPDWVVTYEWSKEQKKETSLREMRLLAQEELQRRTAGRKLPEEGKDL